MPADSARASLSVMCRRRSGTNELVNLTSSTYSGTDGFVVRGCCRPSRCCSVAWRATWLKAHILDNASVYMMFCGLGSDVGMGVGEEDAALSVRESISDDSSADTLRGACFCGEAWRIAFTR